MDTNAEIIKILTDTLQAEQVKIIDDSAKHTSHQQAKLSGGGHYYITVVSEKFEGKKPLARHRLVYDALKEEFKARIHALSIKAYTPKEDIEYIVKLVVNRL